MGLLKGKQIETNTLDDTKSAQMAANTIKANATAALANQANLAMPASTILARLATGNIVAATPAQISALLGPSNALSQSIAQATADATTSSATYVALAGMTLTPVAGTYMVWFSASGSNSFNNASSFVSLFSGGVAVAASDREYDKGNQDVGCSIASQALVTVNGSQAIEARFRSANGPYTIHQRTLSILRVA